MNETGADLKRLGSVIASRLEDRSLTQQWLAAQVGVSQATISRIIQGKFGVDAEAVYKIGEALGIDPVYLLRLAGLPLPESPLDPTAAYIAQRLTQLPPDLRYETMDTVGRIVDLAHSTMKGTGAANQAVESAREYAERQAREDMEQEEEERS